MDACIQENTALLEVNAQLKEQVDDQKLWALLGKKQSQATASVQVELQPQPNLSTHLELSLLGKRNLVKALKSSYLQQIGEADNSLSQGTVSDPNSEEIRSMFSDIYMSDSEFTSISSRMER